MKFHTSTLQSVPSGYFSSFSFRPKFILARSLFLCNVFWGLGVTQLFGTACHLSPSFCSLLFSCFLLFSLVQTSLFVHFCVISRATPSLLFSSSPFFPPWQSQPSMPLATQYIRIVLSYRVAMILAETCSSTSAVCLCFVQVQDKKTCHTTKLPYKKTRTYSNVLQEHFPKTDTHNKCIHDSRGLNGDC